MISYLKLLDFELKRSWKIYFAILGSAMVMECLMVAHLSNRANERAVEGTIDTAFEGIILFSQVIGEEILFYFPIFFCITALIIYIFFTWYREWYGKYTFVYQLLLLSGSRMAIYFAKLTAFLLMVFGCLVAQIAVFPVLTFIYRSILGKYAETSISLSSWINGDALLSYLIPGAATDFLLAYGIGLTSVIVVFTMILLERSYRYKGIAAAIVYGYLCWEIMKIPQYLGHSKALYNGEYMMLNMAVCIAIVAVSLVWSRHLINKKIWV